jgi:biopolymer transport protein ExbB
MMQKQQVVVWRAVPLLALVAFTTSLSGAAAQEPAGDAGAVPEAVAVAPAVGEPVAPSDAPPAPRNLLVYYFRALGPTFVIVFLGLSFALVALLVMCFLQLRRTVLLPPELVEGFEAHIEKKEFQQAYELAKGDDSPLGRVLAAALVKLQIGYEQALEAMREVQAEEVMRLEHKISYVSLVGALAPMFGLLGTVSGMVAAFSVIAQSATQPKPAELASGISQALVTTLIGLWLAIPANACFSLFRNWLERFSIDLDSESVRLIAKVPVAKK